MVATTDTKHGRFLRQAECRLPGAIKETCRVSRRASRHDEGIPAEAGAIVRIVDDTVPDAPISGARFAYQIEEELLLAWLVHICFRTTDAFCEALRAA